MTSLRRKNYPRGRGYMKKNQFKDLFSFRKSHIVENGPHSPSLHIAEPCTNTLTIPYSESLS